MLAFSFNAEMGVEFLKSETRPDNSQNMEEEFVLRISPGLSIDSPKYLQKSYSVPCFSVGFEAIETERPCLSCAGETSSSCCRKSLLGF